MSNIVVGNSLASLVATYKICQKGIPVTLIRNGGRWGGHFAGIEACGEHFDLGMSIIELGYKFPKEQKKLLKYDTKNRNDVGNYFKLIKQFLESFIEIRKISKPQCFFRGHYFDDFLLCNSLEVLQSLNQDEKKRVILELESIEKKPEIHASNKLIYQDIHSTISYTESSQYNHGNFLHNLLLKPFVKKLTNSNTDNFCSLYHRRLWLPLYYPETLAAYLRDGEFLDLQTDIYYPNQGSMATVGDTLFSKIKKNTNCTIIEKKVSRLTKKSVFLECGKELEYKNIAWGSSLINLFKATSIQPVVDKSLLRADLSFIFVVLNRARLLKEFSILFNLDDISHCYRITNITNCKGNNNSEKVNLILEYNTAVLHSLVGKRSREKVVYDTLKNFGIIDDNKAVLELEIMDFEQILPFPTNEQDIVINKNLSIINKAYPKVYTMGTASRASTRSFADNIIQGMQYAELTR